VAKAPPERRLAGAYIGLGSNLAQPRQQLRQALQELQGLEDSRLQLASSIYASPPMGPPDQPDYLNAVAAIETGMQPLKLLESLQQIEAAHQRVRGRRWGERTLDLDLLLYDNLLLHSATLTVPHPGITQRAFVLVPLLEIAPGITIPGKGPAQDYLARVAARQVRRVASSWW
jgi:2-amino-4-hydroxy-6-hydroxymethyldihydropteridine diphosphokinase